MPRPRAVRMLEAEPDSEVSMQLPMVASSGSQLSGSMALDLSVPSDALAIGSAHQDHLHDFPFDMFAETPPLPHQLQVQPADGLCTVQEMEAIMSSPESAPSAGAMHSSLNEMDMDMDMGVDEVDEVDDEDADEHPLVPSADDVASHRGHKRSGGELRNPRPDKRFRNSQS